MATLILSSSNWDAGRVRITYTASNGTLKITEIEGCRTDGYHSWNASDTSITIKIGGTSKSVSLSHYIDFTASSSYTAWGATDTSWTGLSGTSIGISITMPSSTQAYSGAVFSGNATMSWTKYTIAYNANGGTGAPSSQTKTHGTNLTLSSTKPTRTGYTFKGWALTQADANSGTWYYQAGGTCGKNEDLTLYAVWEEHILTVNYYSNYATSAFADAENTVGADKNVKVWSSKIYYDNDYSTYGLANYSNSSGSVYMTRTGYTATGNWGTSTSGGTLINENTGYTTGQALAKALGKDLSFGNASINVYAQWEANSYTYNIVYKSSTGVQLGTATISKNYGTTNTVSPKSFAGYTSPSSQSVKWDSTTAKTITFTYTPITYNITINCNGGSGVNSRTYTVETATFTLGTPTRTGYTFNGWTGSNGNTAQKTVSISKGSTGDKSYTAQWRANVLTIKYHINGGKVNSDKYYVNNNLIGLISSSSVLEDKWDYNSGHTDGLYNAKTFGLTREGYKFVGWKLGSSGTTVFDQDDASVVPTDLASDLTTGDRMVTLYAVWEISGVVYIANDITMRTIKGKWLFNDVLTNKNNGIIDVNFVSNGISFTGFRNGIHSGNGSLVSFWYSGSYASEAYFYQSWVLPDGTQYSQGWISNELRYVDFGETEQTVPNEFYEWLILNAVKITDKNTVAVIVDDEIEEISSTVSFEPYHVYIDNGKSWDLYLVYIDDGTDWITIS